MVKISPNVTNEFLFKNCFSAALQQLVKCKIPRPGGSPQQTLLNRTPGTDKDGTFSAKELPDFSTMQKGRKSLV